MSLFHLQLAMVRVSGDQYAAAPSEHCDAVSPQEGLDVTPSQ